MGEWFPIPGPPYWRYDDQAPDADPTVTSMLPVYAAPVITEAGSPADDTTTGPVPVADYVYTDPVADESWPGITEPDDDNPVDQFPPYWGSEPTERDQAAIDAGNA